MSSKIPLPPRRGGLIFAAMLVALAACRQPVQEPQFPAANRDVAPIVGDAFSTEDTRDRLGEAEEVMELAGVERGMSVADVGAGEGYYTVRLSRVVGPNGRVLAEDIVPSVRDALADRVAREKLDNVSVKLGSAGNPMLPAQSFDRVFLVHVYHEVQSPYAFLWHLREAVKPGGLVVVVDSNRPVKRHGITSAQLRCEFAALGMDPARFSVLTGGEAYFMAFRPSRPRPAPEKIQPCRGA